MPKLNFNSCPTCGNPMEWNQVSGWQCIHCSIYANSTPDANLADLLAARQIAPVSQITPVELMQQSELSQSILQQSRETRAALDRVALSTYLPHLDKQRDEVRVSIAVLEQAIPTQQNQKQLANERARLQNLDERIARIERIIEPPPISQPADNSISTAQAWGIAIMIIVIFIIVVAILTT